MSKSTMFSIERSQLPAGHIHEKVKLEMPTLITTKNMKKGIKFVFVNESSEEFSHFIWESDNSYRVLEQNAGVVQILSCFVETKKINDRLLALEREVDPDEMSLDEMIEIYYKHIVRFFLDDADLNTELDIKLIYSHHDNSSSFPNALRSNTKFICVHGKDTLVYSKERFNGEHKRYANQLKEPTAPNEIDDSNSPGFADAPTAGSVKTTLKAPPPEMIDTPLDVDAVFAERAEKVKKTEKVPETLKTPPKPEAKIESIISAKEREAIFENKKALTPTGADDPFGEAMDLPEDDNDSEYPV